MVILQDGMHFSKKSLHPSIFSSEILDARMSQSVKASRLEYYYKWQRSSPTCPLDSLFEVIRCVKVSATVPFTL